MLDLNNHSILVTGGTGSFGKKFAEILIKRYPGLKRLVIFSRDEMKQFEMAQKYPPSKHKFIRYFIGDVRDLERLKLAMEQIDIVVHAAALKQVPTAEYNPMECIKTNIIGAENVINAARSNGVKKVIALSTDKAAAPINLYGATKLCADKLFTAANNMKGKHDILFSVVRYGNVMGSRGSVIPFFIENRKTGVLPITHPEMTRFNITLEEGVNLVLFALENAMGGEIFVPKIPSYKITDLAKAIAPRCKVKIIGVRPGEKIHEEMITETDSLNTYEFDNFYTIMPTSVQWTPGPMELVKKLNGKKVPEGFKYNSGTNPHLLNVGELRELIRKYIK